MSSIFKIIYNKWNQKNFVQRPVYVRCFLQWYNMPEGPPLQKIWANEAPKAMK